MPASRGSVSTAAACSAAVLGAAAAHIGPAATWLPVVRRALFPVLDGRGRSDHVALTFDDGPDPRSTPEFLDVLDRLGARATFFVLGSALLRNPRLGREVAARGHEVAVHGWWHRWPWRPAPVRDLREVRWAARAVQEVCGVPARWFRPPYGVLTGGLWAAARAAGLRPVLWSAWGRDWRAGTTADAVLHTVLAGLHGGETVLLHDSDRMSAPGSWQVTLQALPDLVERCRALDLRVGPLGEHGTACG